MTPSIATMASASRIGCSRSPLSSSPILRMTSFLPRLGFAVSSMAILVAASGCHKSGIRTEILHLRRHAGHPPKKPAPDVRPASPHANDHRRPSAEAARPDNALHKGSSPYLSRHANQPKNISISPQQFRALLSELDD